MKFKSLKARTATVFAGGQLLSRSRKAFTLAETLIVLVVLGIVAAITVPAIVRRHIESERRTKFKKAMSAYETALNKIVIENNLKSDADLYSGNRAFAPLGDCSKTKEYFKISKTLDNTNCRFRTSDGVYWDISNITKTIVSLSEEDLNDEVAQGNSNRAFYMYSWFDQNGSLRVNDLAKIIVAEKAQLAKLYDYISGKTNSSSVEKSSDPYTRYSTLCTNECEINWSEGSSSNCASCTYNEGGEEDWGNWVGKLIFDTNGNIVKNIYTETCNKESGNGSFKCYEESYNPDGTGHEIWWDEDNVEHKIWEKVVNDDGSGHEISTNWNTGEIYTSWEKVVNEDGTGYEVTRDINGNENIVWEKTLNADGSGREIQNGEVVWEKTLNTDGSGRETQNGELIWEKEVLFDGGVIEETKKSTSEYNGWTYTYEKTTWEYDESGNILSVQTNYYKSQNEINNGRWGYKKATYYDYDESGKVSHVYISNPSPEEYGADYDYCEIYYSNGIETSRECDWYGLI